MEEDLAQDPYPFPDFHLHPFTYRLQHIGEPGDYHEAVVFSSSSGEYYESGGVLKKAIYGEVRKGYVLRRSSDGVSFSRTGDMVAIKVIVRERYDAIIATCPEDPLNEMKCLNYIKTTPTSVTTSHPSPPYRYQNICYFYEGCVNAKYYLSIMEFIDGAELFDYLDDRGVLPEDETKVIVKGIATAFNVFYELGIGHRDISCENVMIRNDRSPVVIDFGAALRSRIRANNSHYAWNPRQQIGKRNYIAPEVLLGNASFKGHNIDVWALGIIMFMCMVGFPPMNTASMVDPLFRRIASGNLRELLQSWRIVLNPSAVSLLQSILNAHDPDNRPIASQLLSNEWLRGV